MRLELDAIVPAPPVSTDAGTQAHADSADFAEARSSLNQGIKAAQAGNRAQARTSLLRATELDPRNENAWLWLASISEYPEELLGFLNHVLAINPNNERAVEWKFQTHSLLSRTFVQRGIDASHEGKTDLAAECFQTALEHDDRNAVAWMWMASASDSNEEKITLLQRALALDPENQDASAALNDATQGISKDRLTAAKSAALAGNNADAIDILDDLLRVDGSNIEAWTMRSHLAEGFEEKIRCFESILAIDPENVAAKAGRDSLLMIFGGVDKLSDTAAHEHAPQPANADFVKAVAEPTEQENSTEQIYDPVETQLDFNPIASHADPFAAFAEPTVGLEENEQPYSFEEPTHTIEAQAEVPAEISSQAEPLIVESEPDVAFTPAASEYHEAVVVEEPVSFTDPVEQYGNEEQVPDADEGVWSADVVAEYEQATAYEEPVSFPTPVEPFSNDQPVAASDDWSLPTTVENPEAPTDPQAETVAFKYSELSGDWSVDADPHAGSHAIPRSDAEIPMPVVDLPHVPTESSPITFVEPRHVGHIDNEPVTCAFCSKENEPQSISCARCLAVLTLSDLEMLLGNPHADKLLVRQAVEEMERYRLARSFSPAELVTLGIGHLNLKNLQLGYACLSDASRMTPNDVVLAGQVNSLLIRLDEIRQQEEAHLRMPKGKSILVVDDSPTVRKLIAGKLEKCGHEVLCANDGVEAMERLETLVPDLVLLDINMPRMDGYQVCKLIRSNDATKNVAVVMISGKDGFFDKVRGRMAGTTGYITKPFGPETLMKAVEMYLSGEIPEPEEE